VRVTVSLEELYESLDRLRGSEDPRGFSHRSDWSRVERFLQTTYPRGTEDDARQETLLSVLRNVSRMEATTPKQAAKWIGTIHRRKRVDELRAKKSDPLAKVRSGPSDGDEHTDALERVPATETLHLRSEHFAALLETVESKVEDSLADETPLTRALRRVQARAALRRVLLDESADEIIPALGVPTPPNRDLLYKWIERGRPLVIAALRCWAQAEPQDREVAEALAELMAERRADAGVPRPSRRGERRE
jgi:hypothetical protein